MVAQRWAFLSAKVNGSSRFRIKNVNCSKDFGRILAYTEKYAYLCLTEKFP